MEITSKMVRDLRETTGAGMMECKKALEATRGDFDAAVDHLRKQGIKAAAKKAERATSEGRVFSVIDGRSKRAHLVGVACETDFLAKSAQFRAFVADLEAHVAAEDPDGLDRGARPLLSQRFKGEGPPLSEALKEAIGQFGENIRIVDVARLENPGGHVGGYVHHDNKQGAIVSVTTRAEPARAGEVLKSLCQHIVVFHPVYAERSEVPASEVERERAIHMDSSEIRSKPENLREKVVAGKVNAFFAQCVLADQPWIHDDKKSVQKALEAELGPGTKIEAFRRVHLRG
jgi:elongation factor Ts